MIQETQQEQELKPYEESLNKIAVVFNRTRDKNKAEDFKKVLIEFKNNFKKEISTYFLLNFLGDTTENRKRLNYLLSRANIEIRKERDFKKIWIFEKYKIEISEYEIREGLIYSEPIQKTTEEQTREQEIKNISELSIYELSPHSENYDEKVNLRNAINKGGAVEFKESRIITTARAYKKNHERVLKFLIL